MSKHRATKPTLTSLSAHQWIRITTVTLTFALVTGIGIGARGFYESRHAPSAVTAYSATDTDPLSVSRSSQREALTGVDANTSYVTVKVNGKSRVVFGERFTDVKSVLDAGNITLETGDSVEPSLTTKVSESTVITIQRTDADVETTDEPISFNTVTKETANLAKGVKKVQTEGRKGVMETTSLVTRSGSKTVSSNVFASFVKTAPVDKVILVGTGTSSSTSTSKRSSGSTAAASSIGTTVPVGTMQQWAHDYLLSTGHSEADFTATVYIISHESGWRVNAMNPSGAYGLPQAYPGSKMASAGADWATNYQTQLKWFWNYCNRYGGIQGAYQHWLVHHNY